MPINLSGEKSLDKGINIAIITNKETELIVNAFRTLSSRTMDEVELDELSDFSFAMVACILTLLIMSKSRTVPTSSFCTTL